MTPQENFQGQTIAVTGAGGSLGAAVCERLLAAGAIVFAVDLSGDALDALSSRALSHRERLHSRVVDVTSEQDVAAFAAWIRDTTGSLDGFFNNAGIHGPISTLPELDIEALARTLRVNVIGVALGLKHILPIMSKGSSVVNAGSTASLNGALGMGAYVASKHAVLGLTRTAALEARAGGVRVNCICPGAVDSPMMADIDRERSMKLESARDPRRKYARVEDVAEAVTELLRRGSSMITGQAVSFG